MLCFMELTHGSARIIRSEEGVVDASIGSIVRQSVIENINCDLLGPNAQRKKWLSWLRGIDQSVNKVCRQVCNDVGRIIW